MQLIRRLLRRPYHVAMGLLRHLMGAPAAVRRAARRLWIRAKVLRRLAEKEAEWKAPLRYRRPRWWWHGFLSRSSILYDLDHNDPGAYITDLQRYFSTRRMVHPRLQEVINNKLTTHLLLQALGVRTPELLGLYWRGGVHRFPHEQRDPLVEFLGSLADGQRVFFKPLSGAEGKNLFSVRRTGDGYRVNGSQVALATVRAAIEAPKRPLVVEAGVEQHPTQRALFAETTNTLRLLTMLDMRDRSPFIVVAVQRIGAHRSGAVDNWTQGGLSARVDLETGVLGKATRLPDGDRLEWFERHPDTGAPIEGSVVPYWDEVVATVLQAARSISFLEYVGWDVIVTADGPVVLEANINSGMNVLQVHQPLLADPRARAYMEKRGVVGPPEAGEDDWVRDNTAAPDDPDDLSPPPRVATPS
jgi:hypothetical protein